MYFNFFIGTELLYNVMLVFAVQYHESTMGLHIVPSLSKLPPTKPNPTALGHRGAPGWAPRAVWQLPASCLFHTTQCIFGSAALPVCTTLLSPFCVRTAIEMQMYRACILECCFTCVPQGSEKCPAKVVK